jgi:hypothetical protein
VENSDSLYVGTSVSEKITIGKGKKGVIILGLIETKGKKF